MKQNNLFLFLFILLTINYLNAQNLNFVWAKQFGGTNTEIGLSSVVDVYGNIYTLGHFSGTIDADPGVESFFLTSAGSSDIFLSKLNASGDFLWAKQIGGVYTDAGYSIITDEEGDIYLTGCFMGPVDFDPNEGTHIMSSIIDVSDFFILKLNASGVFVWSRQSLGTRATNCIYSIALGPDGNIYTSGQFFGTVDFNPGAESFVMTSFGYSNPDIFICKFSSTGNFIWAKQLGGTSYDDVYSLKTDNQGNVHTIGHFHGTADFDPGSSIFEMSCIWGSEVFISKLSSSGNFIWAKQMGNLYDNDWGYSLAIDSQGNVYSTGSFTGTADFDPGEGTFNLTSFSYPVGTDIFVSKLNASGNFVWARQLGGTNYGDVGYAIALDDDNNIYSTGTFGYSADFDPGPESFYLSSNGDYDVFISKLNNSGNIVWAKQIGGPSIDYGRSLIIDPNKNLYITGYFYETVDFDPGVDLYNLISNGNADIFVVKLNQGSSEISLSGNLIFGEVQVGAVSQKILTISNTGSADISVTSISFPYSVFTANWTGNIPPGSHQEVTVSFEPTEAINYSGLATVASNALGGNNEILISGSGTHDLPLNNTISNIIIIQRSDGSGMVDLYFNLNGTAPFYTISMQVSFDGGITYTDVPAAFLSGNAGSISPGSNKHIVWDGLGSFPNTYSTTTKLKITANQN